MIAILVLDAFGLRNWYFFLTGRLWLKGKEWSFTFEEVGRSAINNCGVHWKHRLRMIVHWKLHFGGTWFHNRPDMPYVGGLMLKDQVGSDYASLVKFELQMRELEFVPPVEYFYKFEGESTKDLRIIENEMHLLRIVESMEQRGIDTIEVFVKHAWNDHDIMNEEAEEQGNNGDNAVEEQGNNGDNAAEEDQEANDDNAVEEVPNESGGDNDSEGRDDDHLPSDVHHEEDDSGGYEEDDGRVEMEMDYNDEEDEDYAPSNKDQDEDLDEEFDEEFEEGFGVEYEEDWDKHIE
ncbi:hypothetical protein Tsubulata_027540, partial [Turnera subulata]